MSKTVSWGISANGSGDGITAFAYAPVATITNTAAPSVGAVSLTLSTGFNAVPIPTGAKGVIIDWGGAAATVTEKGITTDTGFAISTAVPMVKSWDAVTPAPTTLGLTVSAGITVVAYWR